MFFIVRRSKDSDNYEVYRALKSTTQSDAINEAAEYLSDNGAPATGENTDLFEVAQIVSKPLRALLSVLAATRTTQERRQAASKVLARVLQEGEC